MKRIMVVVMLSMCAVGWSGTPLSTTSSLCSESNTSMPATLTATSTFSLGNKYAQTDAVLVYINPVHLKDVYSLTLIPRGVVDRQSSAYSTDWASSQTVAFRPDGQGTWSHLRFPRTEFATADTTCGFYMQALGTNTSTSLHMDIRLEQVP